MNGRDNWAGSPRAQLGKLGDIQIHPTLDIEIVCGAFEVIQGFRRQVRKPFEIKMLVLNHPMKRTWRNRKRLSLHHLQDLITAPLVTKGSYR